MSSGKNSFLSANSMSEQLWKSACSVMPGGNARSTVFFLPRPVYADYGSGCYITDVEGVKRIDFINNQTSLVHGHAYGPVIEAVSKRLAMGTAFAWPTGEEVNLAQEIAERLPFVEHLRFANSGSEAVLHAIKGARGYTGRNKIAKFEGCYHGNYDHMMVSFAPHQGNWGDKASPASVLSNGDSPHAAEETVILPFNDLDVTVERIRKHKDTLAAVVLDPIPVRAGLVPAGREFLLALREVTRELGILLISDEVISFRTSYRGGQGLFDYSPDLTALGKIIGGGFPVGALGGRRDVMSVFDPSQGSPRVQHMGTFSANPVTMVAGLAALNDWTEDAIDRVNELGGLLRKKGNELMEGRDFDGQITGLTSLFHIHVKAGPITNYRDLALSQEKGKILYEVYLALLDAGVVLSPTCFGCISTPMTEHEVDGFLNALEYALDQVAKKYPKNVWGRKA